MALTTAQQLEKLRAELGDGDVVPNLAKPPATLPNGRYPVHFRMHQIGVAIDYAIEQVGAFAERLKTFESRPSPSVQVPTAPVDTVALAESDLIRLAEKLLPYLPSSGGNSIRGEKDAALFMRANTARAATQDDITDEYDGELQLAGGDGGLRVLQNYNCRGTGQLPWSVFGPNSHGTWEYNWYPPLKGFQGSEGDYAVGQGTGNYWEQGIFDQYGRQINDAYKGQTLVIDGGAQGATAGDGQTYISRQHHALIAAQRESWPIIMCVTPQRNPYPSNIGVLKLDAANNGEQNRVMLFIDGELRRVKAKPDGTLYYDVAGGGQ